MLIVGELINTSRSEIKRAVEERNKKYIQTVAQKQTEAGADYLDVNCGTLVGGEAETLEWLLQVVQDASSLPVCCDTPDMKTMEIALASVRQGQPMINSITAEKERFFACLPLVLKYKAKVIALCMNDNGIPDSVAGRMNILAWLVENLTSAGVRPDDIYIDPLVMAISTGDKYGAIVLETIRLVRENFPRTHCIAGLSNVSYGMPNRRVLNQTFLIQTMTVGMDAYLLDPLDRSLMGFLYASEALLGQDPYCREYINAHRAGLYRV